MRPTRRHVGPPYTRHNGDDTYLPEIAQLHQDTLRRSHQFQASLSSLLSGQSLTVSGNTASSPDGSESSLGCSADNTWSTSDSAGTRSAYDWRFNDGQPCARLDIEMPTPHLKKEAPTEPVRPHDLEAQWQDKWDSVADVWLGMLERFWVQRAYEVLADHAVTAQVDRRAQRRELRLLQRMTDLLSRYHLTNAMDSLRDHATESAPSLAGVAKSPPRTPPTATATPPRSPSVPLSGPGAHTCRSPGGQRTHHMSSPRQPQPSKASGGQVTRSAKQDCPMTLLHSQPPVQFRLQAVEELRITGIEGTGSLYVSLQGPPEGQGGGRPVSSAVVYDSAAQFGGRAAVDYRFPYSEGGVYLFRTAPTQGQGGAHGALHVDFVILSTPGGPEELITQERLRSPKGEPLRARPGSTEGPAGPRGGSPRAQAAAATPRVNAAATGALHTETGLADDAPTAPGDQPSWGPDSAPTTSRSRLSASSKGASTKPRRRRRGQYSLDTVRDPAVTWLTFVNPSTGQPYFYNLDTGETVFEPPTGRGQLAPYPHASPAVKVRPEPEAQAPAANRHPQAHHRLQGQRSPRLPHTPRARLQLPVAESWREQLGRGRHREETTPRAPQATQSLRQPQPQAAVQGPGVLAPSQPKGGAPLDAPLDRHPPQSHPLQGRRASAMGKAPFAPRIPAASVRRGVSHSVTPNGKPLTSGRKPAEASAGRSPLPRRLGGPGPPRGGLAKQQNVRSRQPAAQQGLPPAMGRKTKPAAVLKERHWRKY